MREREKREKGKEGEEERLVHKMLDANLGPEVKNELDLSLVSVSILSVLHKPCLL